MRSALVGTNNGSLLDTLATTNARVSTLIFGINNYTGGTPALPSGQGGWRQRTPLAVSNTTSRTTLANSIPTTRPNQTGTNWQSGLQAVAQETQFYDLVLFITDGAPNMVLSSLNADGTSSGVGAAENETNVSLRALEAATFAANNLKNKRSRVVAVGVGDGVSGVNAARVEHNLRVVSGEVKGSDFFQEQNWDNLKSYLQSIARSATCQVSVNVNKTEVPLTGPDRTFAAGWDFQGTKGGSADVTLIGDSSQTTAAGTGGQANWALRFTKPTGQTASITITEPENPAKSNWNLTDVSCTRNGLDIEASLNPDGRSVTVSGLDAASGIVNCTFTNKEQKRDPIVCTADKYYTVRDDGRIYEGTVGSATTTAIPGQWARPTGSGNDATTGTVYNWAVNGLGIVQGGNVAYAFGRYTRGSDANQSSNPNQFVKVLKYDARSGAFTHVGGQLQVNTPANGKAFFARMVAGAVDPISGNYYFGGYGADSGNDSQFRLYKFDVSTNTTSYVGWIQPDDVGVNDAGNG